MSELPGRPNLDQLRRQARELLRAAAGGEPSAQTRIGAVSERVTLSAAQLALAREYGFTSWPALHAEVARRRVELPPEGTGRAGTRWSFGGAAAIETAAGTLYPGGLVAGPEDAVLAASLTPSAQAWYQFPAPRGTAAPGKPGTASMPPSSSRSTAASRSPTTRARPTRSTSASSAPARTTSADWYRCS
jgi:hypothetical protein